MKIIFRILSIVGALLAAAILWQHVANINEWHYRPSQSLTAVARWCEHAWTVVGEWFAWASSFVEYLHFKELLRSAGEIFAPLMRIALSWLYTGEGYCKYIVEHHYTTAVVAGSLILVGVFILLLARYGERVARWIASRLPQSASDRLVRAIDWCVKPIAMPADSDASVVAADMRPIEYTMDTSGFVKSSRPKRSDRN